MYQGNNKTALCSQQQIARAFTELLREQPYPSISISTICKNAGVSRQTFYSLFESKENIILYILEKKHSFDPGQKCSVTSLSLEELCREYTQYIVEKQDFLSLLVKNELIYLMHDSLFNSFSSCSCFLPDTGEKERTFAAEFIAGALSGIAKIYTLHSSSVSEEDLTRIIYQLFHGDFFS